MSKNRFLILAVVWIAFGAYSGYLFYKHGKPFYFALIVVGAGLAMANIMRYIRR